MYYFCPLCSSDREDSKGWFDDKELPSHLFKAHQHRLRTLDEILREWSSLGMLETSETVPENNSQMFIRMPQKLY